MTLGCQRMYAWLDGIPCWCAGREGHEDGCFWPDVRGYSNISIKPDPKTWPGTANFRFPDGMPPVLEEKRNGHG